MSQGPFTQPASRDNNFNLLRALAALAVLGSHSFTLALGPTAIEPLMTTLGMSLGTMAVGVFFTISGYLVTASLLSRGSVSDFLLARARRIYPGLWVALALTVLVLGPMATTLGVSEYLTHPRTWFHALKNGTLLFGFVDRLPGVFAGLPYAHTVNGSLWTLPLELRLYLSLAAIYLLLTGLARGRERTWIAPLIAVLATVCVLLVAWQGAGSSAGLRFAALFFVGAAMQVYRHRVAFGAGGMLAALAALVAASVDAGVFALAFVTAGGYLVLCAAFVPGGVLRRYNRLGDYSYGLYIYAFPVQQTVASLVPGIGVAGMFIASSAITLVLAMASWRFVEAPMLRKGASVSAVPADLPRAA